MPLNPLTELICHGLSAAQPTQVFISMLFQLKHNQEKTLEVGQDSKSLELLVVAAAQL